MTGSTTNPAGVEDSLGLPLRMSHRPGIIYPAALRAAQKGGLVFLIALSLYLASGGVSTPHSGYYGYHEGIAKHYDAGVFRQVLKVRQRQGLIPWGVRYDGLASTTDCANIGKYVTVSLQNPRTGEWSAPRSLLVADCSRPGADRARHIRTGLVVEVDYRTARATGWGWDGRRGEGKARARVWGVR